MFCNRVVVLDGMEGVLAYCSRFFLIFQRLLGEYRDLLFRRGV